MIHPGIRRFAWCSVVGMMIGLLAACGRGAVDPADAEPARSAVAGASLAVEVRPDRLTPDAIAPPEIDAAVVVTRFAAAWVRPDLSTEVWQAELSQLCTPRYGALLRSADPANVSARRITGPPTLTGRRPGVLEYAVTTDAGTLAVTVIAQNGQWKVNGLGFAPSNPTVPAPQPQPKPTSAPG